MAGKGETVKYVIDADTSGFSRGMAAAALESEVTGRKIDRNLSRTAKRSENNFNDIRSGAQRTASQIRNFGVALQGFNMTSIIIGISALSGAVIELSGAIAAAGSTLSILLPAISQGGAAMGTFKAGVAGLGDAFKAIQKNDGKAFKESLSNLGPAATSVAYSLAGLEKAFRSIRLNVQQALFAGVGDEMLRVGAIVLPTLNAGMQRVGQSMNTVLKTLGQLASTPLFNGLLATIFSDTANNITTMSGALSPLLSILTNLYLITRPYVALLAQQFVNLTNNLAAYLGSAKGQNSLNTSIQVGIVAIQQLSKFVSAAFGLLTSLFRTSVESGVSLISTLTNIIKNTQAWVNSAKGQRDLIALFNFSSLVIQNVAHSLGIALQLFFGIIRAVDSLSPSVQRLVLQFLSLALAAGPVGGYFLKLFGAIRLVATTIFNLAQQLWVVFGVLGAVSSIALILAGGLIILGMVIKGPLGGALIILGAAIAAYIGLSYIASLASQTAASSFFEQGVAALWAESREAELAGVNILLANTMYVTAAAAANAGVGMSFAARGAMLLQASILPLIVAAAGLLVILSMLGVFNSKGKQATGTSVGLGNSLGSLQKAMKGVGAAGNKTSNNGLSALNDSLNSIGDAANTATGSLASFDKMNVLTDNANAGIAGVPSLPNVGAGSLGAPPLDTTAFDNSLSDMQKNFENLQKKLSVPLSNPFAAIGEWINAHPWIALAGFTAILVAVGLAFTAFGVTVSIAALPLTLIVLGIIAIIAIAYLLWKHWDEVTAAMVKAWNWVYSVFQSVGTAIWNFFQSLGTAIGGFFYDAWQFIVGIWNGAMGFFQAVWNGIVKVFSVIVSWFGTQFTNAWNGIVLIWNAAGGFFQGVWNGITGVFGAVGSWFGGVFNSAWDAIRNAFSAVGGFFQGVWNTIVHIFGSVGASIGDAISGAVKSVINAVLNTVSNIVNTVINTINGAIRLINKLPGINVGMIGNVTLPRLARGGVVNSPTFAQLGEAGAEAVMPLENNTGWIDKLADKINAANGGGDGQPINLTVQIGEDKVANKIINLINEKTAMSGRNSIWV